MKLFKHWLKNRRSVQRKKKIIRDKEVASPTTTTSNKFCLCHRVDLI